MYTQNNIQGLFQLIGRFENQQYASGELFDYIKTVDNVWPNQLLNLQANASNIDELLDFLEAESSLNRLPSLLMSNPIKDDLAVIERIELRSYQRSEWSAMNFDVQTANLPELLYDIEISKIGSEDELRQWMEIVEHELMQRERLNFEVFHSLLKHHSCYFFMGFSDGIPVATAFLFQEFGYGGIYLVSTKESHRKLGIGRQMTLKCLETSEQLGCATVELQATALGKGVYSSLGFNDFGEIKVYRIEST